MAAEALGALAKVFVVQALDRQDLAELRAAPAPLAHLAVETQPTAQEHDMRAAVQGVDRQANAVGEGQRLLAELAAIEERRVQLEVLGLHVGEDHHVVLWRISS